MDRRTRSDKIAEFFGSDQLVRVFRPLAEEVFNRGGSPEDLEPIISGTLLRDELARIIIGESHIKATLPVASKVRICIQDQDFWLKKDGHILFKVTSDGTTGPEWVKRLEERGLFVSPCAKSVLFSPDFRPTSGKIMQIFVCLGNHWRDEHQSTGNIRAMAKALKLVSPNPEVACLIREKFSGEEIKAMGFLQIVVMHEPITIGGGYPCILRVYREDDGQSMSGCYGGSVYGWNRDVGFAFVIP